MSKASDGNFWVAINSAPIPKAFNVLMTSRILRWFNAWVPLAQINDYGLILKVCVDTTYDGACGVTKLHTAAVSDKCLHAQQNTCAYMHSDTLTAKVPMQSDHMFCVCNHALLVGTYCAVDCPAEAWKSCFSNPAYVAASPLSSSQASGRSVLVTCNAG